MRIAGLVVVLAAVILAGLLAGGWHAWTWQVHDVHETLVAVANIISASVGVLALSAFLRSGHQRDLGVAIAFFGFVAFYAWHGVFTGSDVPFEWLIYGPAARVAFAAGLLVMMLPARTFQHRVAWGLGAFAAMLATGFALGLAGPLVGDWAAGRTDLGTWRLVIEGSALALIIGAWLGVRRATWMNRVFEAGIAIVAVQSIYFFVAQPWDLVWWGAHALGAGGTVTLAAGVLLVARHHEGEEARQQMLLAARMRQDFINEASHAIRTPLTTLAANLHMMASDHGDSPRIQSMRRAIQRLENLSGQMLSLAEDGSLKRRRVAVRDVVRVAVDAHSHAWPDHPINLDLEEGVAMVDAPRLQVVISHLLDNARKYAPGPVDVAVRRKRSTIEIRVSDQGPGIAKEDRDRVFMPFAGYASGQSSGFTLAWSRRALEAMDGSLTIEGDRGATFVLVLPRARPVRTTTRTSTDPLRKAMQEH